MPAATAAPARHRANTERETLRCRVRLADGRVFSGPLGPERHRALQVGVLHAGTTGLVVICRRPPRWASRGPPPRAGGQNPTTRRRTDHFLPGGQAGGTDWLGPLLALAARHADAGEEVFLARAVRAQPRGDKHAVSDTRFLWVGVDRPDGLPALWAFLAERPCHLLVESSAGHAHAYWKLDRPLPATVSIESTGELVEPIERAHLRLIHHLGTGADGKPNVADPACAERSRVMRLAGSVNGKTGAHARILEADLALPAYPIRQLVGDLPDPSTYAPPHPSAGTTNTDPYKRIGPREYFERLAGIVVPRDGLVNCPAHEDRVPCCSVGTEASQGWRCHAGGCGARGAIYDLASVLLGGPWGPQLRGEAFKRARAYVIDAFGEQIEDHDGTASGRPR
jgi:hypothetical protein